MGQQGNLWTNDMAPNQMGGGLVSCPICGGEVTGPFAAVTAGNKTVRKWSCTNHGCPYIWKIESGTFKNAFEANPVTFG